MKTYIGIDPGLTGAIASISPIGLVLLHDMPILNGKGKTQLDYANLAHVLRQYDPLESMAVIEQVGSMPGQGVSSMFKFGQVYGAALGILAALQIPYIYTTPVQWKRHHRLIGCEKDESRGRALELFPGCVAALRLKKHHGRADALLMAEYLRAKDLKPAELKQCS
jgi:crossover junction endodeoxyribonuclease RuvC